MCATETEIWVASGVRWQLARARLRARVPAAFETRYARLTKPAAQKPRPPAAPHATRARRPANWPASGVRLQARVPTHARVPCGSASPWGSGRASLACRPGWCASVASLGRRKSPTSLAPQLLAQVSTRFLRAGRGVRVWRGGVGGGRCEITDRSGGRASCRHAAERGVQPAHLFEAPRGVFSFSSLVGAISRQLNLSGIRD